MIDLEDMFFRHSKLSYRVSVGQCPRAPAAIGNAAGIEANVLESHVWKDRGPLLSINRGATRSDKTSTQRMQRGPQNVCSVMRSRKFGAPKNYVVLIVWECM